MGIFSISPNDRSLILSLNLKPVILLAFFFFWHIFIDTMPKNFIVWQRWVVFQLLPSCRMQVVRQIFNLLYQTSIGVCPELSMNLFTFSWYLLIIFTNYNIVLPFPSLRVIKHFTLSIKYAFWPILKLQTPNIPINLWHQISGYFMQMATFCLYLCRKSTILSELHIIQQINI